MLETLKPRVSLDEATHERTRPRVAILSLWAAIGVLTLYGAPSIREEVDKSERLAHSPLSKVAAAAEAMSDSVGAPAARALVDGVRRRVQSPWLIWVQPPAPPAPPAAETSTTASPEVATQHRAPKRKRRVLVIGASSIQFALGVELEHEVPKYSGAAVKRLGKLATGLARPDFFDWPATLESLAKQFRPDLVIANFGGNCAQDIPVGSEMLETGTPEWRAEYGARVKRLIDIARKHGADSIYIGMPNMRDPAFAEKMKLVNSVQEEVARAEGAIFVSTWDMTSEADGTYRETVELGKKRGLMRTSDGVHFKPLGAKFIVDQVMQVTERAFVLGTADPALARAEGHAFKASSGQLVEYVAYLPNRATAATPVPVALFFHEGKWAAWPTHPHRSLQRSAEARGFAWIAIGDVVATRELFDDLARHLPVDVERTVIVGPTSLEPTVAGLNPAVFEHASASADPAEVAARVAARLATTASR